MQLEIDAAPPEAAALSRAERPPTVLDISEMKPAGETRYPGPSQPRGSRSPGANPANGSGIAPLEFTDRRSAPHTAATGVNKLLLL